MASDDRLDLYGPIHKKLRLDLGWLMFRLVALGGAQGLERAALLTDLRRQLALREAQISYEARAAGPMLAACLPDAAATMDAARSQLRRALDETSAALDDLEIAPAAERLALARRLGLEFSRLMAEDLAQMYVMETVIQPALQAFYTDAELAALGAAGWFGLEAEMSEAV